MDNEFLANNLFVYIGNDIINLFSKWSIMDKIGFLKCILPNFLNNYCQFLSFVVVLIYISYT
jgi:hypothetical protein